MVVLGSRFNKASASTKDVKSVCFHTKQLTFNFHLVWGSRRYLRMNPFLNGKSQERYRSFGK